MPAKNPRAARLPLFKVGDTVRISHYYQGEMRLDEVHMIGPVVGFTNQGKVKVDIYGDGGTPKSLWPDTLSHVKPEGTK